jgi:hypothetical protein
MAAAAFSAQGGLPAPPVPPGLPRRQASAGATCRICFDDDSAGALFKPCLCDGSMKYIHVSCLDQWREVGGARGGLAAATHCPQCQYEYKFDNFVPQLKFLTHPSAIKILALVISFILYAALWLVSYNAICPLFDGQIFDLDDVISREDWDDEILDSFVMASLLYAVLGWVVMIYNYRLLSETGTGGACSRLACRGCVSAASGCKCALIFGVLGGFIAAWATVHALIKARVTDGRDAAVRYILDHRDVEAAANNTA